MKSRGAPPNTQAPLPAPLRAAAPLAVLLLLSAGTAGCPDSLGALCPIDTKQEGIFTVVLTPDSGPNDCRVTSDGDGGNPDASLFATNPAPTFTAALCTSRLDDGGPAIWLAVSAPKQRRSPLGEGGTFYWHTETLFTGLRCSCPIFVEEQIEGRILPAQDDAGLSQGDAGLPPLKGFVATVRDLVDAGSSADGGPCYCNLPCTSIFDLKATRQ